MSSRQLRWRPAAVVALLLAFYIGIGAATIGANPFKGQTVTPFDILVSQRAWSFVDPHVHVRDFQRSDILNALLPAWEEAKRQLHQGRIPTWNDKVAGGGPLLTVSTNIFTPAFAVFAAVPDSALGFYLSVLLNLGLAGLGMHLFLRRRLGAAAAVAGAITFELCGFNAAWLYWPHVMTLIWAPWLLWAIDRCVQQPGLKDSLWIGVVSALVCLGGFPFVSVLVLEMAALYALVVWAYASRRQAWAWPFAGWYVAGTVLGLLLAALPLIGLIQWLQHYDLGYRTGRGSYLDIHAWKQLFPPWAYRGQRVEETMYVGIAMMVMALGAGVWALVRWRSINALTVFALALLAVSVGLVFGLWPMWLIGWLPGMAFNAWSRAIGLLDIALITLGALAIDSLWKLWQQNQTRRMIATRALLVLIIFGQTVEMATFFHDFNGQVDARYYYPKTRSIDYMRQHAGPFDYVMTDRSFVTSGTLGVYGLREWLAHYFRTPALQTALHNMAKHPFNSHRASASRFTASDIKYDSLTLANFNVRFIAIDSRKHPSKDANSRFHRVFQANGTAVYENDRSPNGPYFLSDINQNAGPLSGNDVTVQSYRQDLFVLRYTGTQTGLIVVPMSINRDWQITVDDRPVHHKLKNGVLPTVPVKPDSIVRFSYHPTLGRYVTGWLAGILGYLVMLTLLARRLRWTNP